MASDNVFSVEYRASSPGFVRSVGHRVDDVVHAELVRFVGQVDWIVTAVAELPILRDVVVVVDDGEKAGFRVVVLEDTQEERSAPSPGVRVLLSTRVNILLIQSMATGFHAMIPMWKKSKLCL